MFLFCFYFFSIFCFFFFFFFFFFFSIFFFKPKLFYQYLFESLQKEQLRGILLNIYIFNLIILNNALLATFINNQETFQRGPKVVFGVIWRCDVGQSQINIETTLKFTTFNNIKSTLSISTLILTTLDNVKAMLLVSTSSFIMLINIETTSRWQFSKSWKEQKKILNFKKKMTPLIKNSCFWLWSIKKGNMERTMQKESWKV